MDQKTTICDIDLDYDVIILTVCYHGDRFSSQFSYIIMFSRFTSVTRFSTTITRGSCVFTLFTTYTPHPRISPIVCCLGNMSIMELVEQYKSLRLLNIVYVLFLICKQEYLYSHFTCNDLYRNYLFERFNSFATVWVDQEVQSSPFYIDFTIDVSCAPWSVHCQCAVEQN